MTPCTFLGCPNEASTSVLLTSLAEVPACTAHADAVLAVIGEARWRVESVGSRS